MAQAVEKVEVRQPLTAVRLREVLDYSAQTGVFTDAVAAYARAAATEFGAFAKVAA